MNAPQGSNEWLIERAGCATASCFDAVLAKVKTGEASTRRKYRMRVVTERLTGLPSPSFTNAAMQWGKEQEPYARMAYEAKTGRLAIEAPFRKHHAIDWVGASPDGEVEDDGLLELKCPESQTHVDYLTAGVAPSDYMAQMQGQMWVTGRQWCDFASFDPRMPKGLRLFLVRVPRDEKYIAALEAEVIRFLAEVESTLAALRAMADE